MPRLGLHEWTGRPPWPWVPRAQRWSPVRGLRGAGLESGGPAMGGGMVVRGARSYTLRHCTEDHGGGPLPRSLLPHVRPKGTGRMFWGPLPPRAGEPAPVVCRPCLPAGLLGTQRSSGALRATAGQTGAAWAPESSLQSLHSGLSQTVPTSRGLGEVILGANRKPFTVLGRPELAPAGCLVTPVPGSAF